MKKLFYLSAIALLAFATLGCDDKDEPTDIKTAKAKTIGKSICEDLYVIQIFEGKDIPKTTSKNYFYAINIPEEYKKPNLNVNINYRLPETKEIPVCPNMEEGYTCLYVISINLID